jgi:hypothetical protein
MLNEQAYLKHAVKTSICLLVFAASPNFALATEMIALGTNMTGHFTSHWVIGQATVDKNPNSSLLFGALIVNLDWISMS